MLTKCKKTAFSVLASFATLKSLSDEKKYRSPYQILLEFIRYIITSDSLYTFSAIEMKSRLSEHFAFSIPEAVIKTSIKNTDGIILKNGTYYVSMTEIGVNSLFEAKKTEADEYNLNIINLLSEYILSRSINTAICEETLTQELVNFLIEDPSPSSAKYTELISEFILKNEYNKDIQEGLNRIREGSILYIGLSHNIRETGSITNPLTLYLGTEILFSLIGYNGEIFQQFAKDFYDQIRLANSGGQQKIKLHYFSEIKKEVDEFFAIAGDIVDGRRPHLLDKPAMKAITDGCSTSSDVAVKQSDFYYRLQYSYGITEDPYGSYYDEIFFASNLESFDSLDESDKKKTKETGLKFISHINKLRDGKHYYNDLDSEHLLITNTKATLRISKEQTDLIKAEKGLDIVSNFAVSLDRITSLLWYKLGNGFGKRVLPVSVSALLKARVVLSSSIAQNADRVFSEVKKQFKSGSISEDQVAARIIMLRNKPMLPEDLQAEDIDEIMDFSPEYLSRYEELFNNSQNALKEKEALVETIRTEAVKEMFEKDATIASQENVIKEKDDENTMLRNELDVYHRKESDFAKKKERRKNIWRFVWSIIWKVALIAMITSAVVVCEKIFNITIPVYVYAVVDVIGLIAVFLRILKKDKEKYLGISKNPNSIDSRNA